MREAATAKAKHARGKGKRGEREICKLLQKYGYNCRRGWQSRGGAAEADVIADTFPFRIEVKYTETLNIYKAFEQAAFDSPETNNIVCFRRNGTKWRVAVDFETFLIQQKALDVLLKKL